eukprot:15436392-Alexandrium_andersonii.AAC.1
MGSSGPLRRRGRVAYLSSGGADEPALMPSDPVSGNVTSAISGVASLCVWPSRLRCKRAEALEIIIDRSRHVGPSGSTGQRQLADRPASSSGQYEGTKWSCPRPGVWVRRHDSPRIRKYSPEHQPERGGPCPEHLSGHRRTIVRKQNGDSDAQAHAHAH